MSRPSDFAEGRAPARPAFLPVELQGFARLDGELYLCLREVDRLAPFFMNVVSNGDLWMFVGSNGALTAGRRDPDRALFPYQTADKLLRHRRTSSSFIGKADLHVAMPNTHNTLIGIQIKDDYGHFRWLSCIEAFE